jgi:hypothetical protein
LRLPDHLFGFAVNQINQLKDQAFNQINQNQTNDQVDATTNQAINAIDHLFGFD